MLIKNFFIVNNFMVGHNKFRFGVPLVVGDVVPGIKYFYSIFPFN